MLEFADSYCKGLKPGSALRVQISFRYFYEFLINKNLKLENLSSPDICDFLEVLRLRKGKRDTAGRTNMSNASLKRMLISCRAVCRLAGVSDNIWKRALSLTPISKTPEKRSTGRLTGEHVTKLMAKLGSNRRGLVLGAFLGLAFGGALRRGEILKIKLGDINNNPNRLVCRLPDTKNGGTYNQVIAPQFAPYVQKLIEFRVGEGASFDANLITSKYNNEYTADSFNKLLKLYSINVLGFSITTHWGRYSAITKLLEDGHTYKQVQHFSRHSTVQMVEIYDKRMLDESTSLGNILHF